MAVPVPSKRVADFENLGFGMFIHWGLYSQMGMGEWVWFMKKIQKEEYKKLFYTFTAKDFDARKIAKLAKAAGMKYITLTTRHHEGFSLYDTCGLSDFDAPHSPAGRDLVREFVDACREEDIVPFFYHTTLDWDKGSDAPDCDFDAYLEYLRQSVEVLCKNYGKIGGFWFDGNWSKPDADWKLDELYGTIRKYQPEAMIINNTGLSAHGKIGHPEIDSVTFEQGLPHPIDREGMEKYVSGEMCYTINNHWGHGLLDLDCKSPAHLIETLANCRKVGANFLLNVGPDGDGNIPLIMEATLRTLGLWVERYDDIIRYGRPCNIVGSNGKDFGLKMPDGSIYLFVYDLHMVGDDNVAVHHSNEIIVRGFTGIEQKVEKVTWLDNGKDVPFTQGDGLFSLGTVGFPYGCNLVVRVAKIN